MEFEGVAKMSRRLSLHSKYALKPGLKPRAISDAIGKRLGDSS
jgi:hypothetical protein